MRLPCIVILTVVLDTFNTVTFFSEIVGKFSISENISFQFMN